LQWLEARHRAHARVEDRIRCANDTGLRRLPSREFAINRAWCVAGLIGDTFWPVAANGTQAAMSATCSPTPMRE
jgi:hypothetical protein